MENDNAGTLYVAQINFLEVSHSKDGERAVFLFLAEAVGMLAIL